MPKRPPATEPVYDHPPDKVDAWRVRRFGLDLFENAAFAIVAVLALIFGIALLRQSEGAWSFAGYLIIFWAVMAYLALPRVHRLLSAIYVPGYFIGRTRTSDGLLGDPINLAVRGDAGQIHTAMRAAGWTLADPITLRSSIKIVVNSITRRSYAEAPVSPLILFGHPQAFAYQQEVEGNPAQRHHVRFWPCPPGWLLPGGYQVDWLAAGTYDRAVGLSLFTLQVTHKIDRNIDIERDYAVNTVRYAVPRAGLHVINDFSTGYHTRNGGGDEVVTDGNLPILELGDVHADPSATAQTPAEPEDLTHEMLDSVGRRPVAIVAAWVLLLISAGVSIAASLEVWVDVASFPEVKALGPTERWIVPASIVGFTLAIHSVILWLAWRTFRGGLLSRLTLIVMITASQAVAAPQSLFGPRATSLSLLTMSLDLFTLYALTTVSAREWTLTTRQRRKALARFRKQRKRTA